MPEPSRPAMHFFASFYPRSTRRTYSPTFEAKVAFVAIRGDSTLADLAAHFKERERDQDVSQWTEKVRCQITDMWSASGQHQRKPLTKAA